MFEFTNEKDGNDGFLDGSLDGDDGDDAQDDVVRHLKAQGTTVNPISVRNLPEEKKNSQRIEKRQPTQRDRTYGPT